MLHQQLYNAMKFYKSETEKKLYTLATLSKQSDKVYDITNFNTQNPYLSIGLVETSNENEELVKKVASMTNRLSKTDAPNNAKKRDDTRVDRYEKLLECIDEYNKSDDQLFRNAVSTDINNAIRKINREMISPLADTALINQICNHLDTGNVNYDNMMDIIDKYSTSSRDSQLATFSYMRELYNIYKASEMDEELKNEVMDSYNNASRIYSDQKVVSIKEIDIDKNMIGDDAQRFMSRIDSVNIDTMSLDTLRNVGQSYYALKNSVSDYERAFMFNAYSKMLESYVDNHPRSHIASNILTEARNEYIDSINNIPGSSDIKVLFDTSIISRNTNVENASNLLEAYNNASMEDKIMLYPLASSALEKFNNVKIDYVDDAGNDSVTNNEIESLVSAVSIYKYASIVRTTDQLRKLYEMKNSANEDTLKYCSFAIKNTTEQMYKSAESNSKLCIWIDEREGEKTISRMAEVDNIVSQHCVICHYPNKNEPIVFVSEQPLNLTNMQMDKSSLAEINHSKYVSSIEFDTAIKNDEITIQTDNKHDIKISVPASVSKAIDENNDIPKTFVVLNIQSNSYNGSFITIKDELSNQEYIIESSLYPNDIYNKIKKDVELSHDNCKIFYNQDLKTAIANYTLDKQSEEILKNNNGITISEKINNDHDEYGITNKDEKIVLAYNDDGNIKYATITSIEQSKTGKAIIGVYMENENDIQKMYLNMGYTDAIDVVNLNAAKIASNNSANVNTDGISLTNNNDGIFATINGKQLRVLGIEKYNDHININTEYQSSIETYSIRSESILTSSIKTDVDKKYTDITSKILNLDGVVSYVSNNNAYERLLVGDGTGTKNILAIDDANKVSVNLSTDIIDGNTSYTKINAEHNSISINNHTLPVSAMIADVHKNGNARISVVSEASDGIQIHHIGNVSLDKMKTFMKELNGPDASSMNMEQVVDSFNKTQSYGFNNFSELKHVVGNRDITRAKIVNGDLHGIINGKKIVISDPQILRNNNEYIVNGDNSNYMIASVSKGAFSDIDKIAKDFTVNITDSIYSTKIDDCELIKNCRWPQRNTDKEINSFQDLYIGFISANIDNTLISKCKIIPECGSVIDISDKSIHYTKDAMNLLEYPEGSNTLSTDQIPITQDEQSMYKVIDYDNGIAIGNDNVLWRMPVVNIESAAINKNNGIIPHNHYDDTIALGDDTPNIDAKYRNDFINSGDTLIINGWCIEQGFNHRYMLSMEENNSLINMPNDQRFAINKLEYDNSCNKLFAYVDTPASMQYAIHEDEIKVELMSGTQAEYEHMEKLTNDYVGTGASTVDRFHIYIDRINELINETKVENDMIPVYDENLKFGPEHMNKIFVIKNHEKDTVGCLYTVDQNPAGSYSLKKVGTSVFNDYKDEYTSFADLSGKSIDTVEIQADSLSEMKQRGYSFGSISKLDGTITCGLDYIASPQSIQRGKEYEYVSSKHIDHEDALRNAEPAGHSNSDISAAKDESNDLF